MGAPYRGEAGSFPIGQRRSGGGRAPEAAANQRERREMAAEAAAAAVVARLRALPRPPPVLEAPLEPSAALRLLCTPSGPRLALLEWICCRVNPPLTKRLDELRDEPEEVRLNELMALAEELMLCEAEDMALVEGTAPPEQQLGFIRDLLDAAPSQEEREKKAESG
ncbi:HAUS augmin-like complex subunit 7 [Ara ararauna]